MHRNQVALWRLVACVLFPCLLAPSCAGAVGIQGVLGCGVETVSGLVSGVHLITVGSRSQ